MAEERLQRRLAAILSADVVGYSRLMGLDEAGTLSRLNALRRELIDPTIAAYSGRIVKLMGDGALMEFASAVDAVTCAIEIQTLLRVRGGEEADPIQFRIGINVGDIIIEGDDILGDGVNVAARIEGLAEPGGISISEDAWRQVQAKVAASFVDGGEQKLKNIERPVRVYHIRSSPSAPTGPVKAAPAAPRLSIVVLPFVNLSRETSEDYFAEGITEDITTDLSRIPESFVIARNTAYTYKGKTVDARTVARELNVRYVLEGSVRRAGNHVRTNAQLIDADSGAHLWAERFDCDRADVMEVQDEIVGRIAGALGTQLIDAESRRSLKEHPTDPDAVDLSMRGWAVLHRPPSRESLADARALFERALALDKDAADAAIGLAYTYARMVNSAFSETVDADLAKGNDLIAKASTIAPERAAVYWVRGLLLRQPGRLEEAAAAFEQAIALNPNFAPAYGSLGDVMTWLDQPEETIRLNERAIRLSPRDPQLANWQFDIGLAYWVLGDEARAIQWMLRARASNSQLPTVPITLCGIYALQGKLDLARTELKLAQERAAWLTSVARLRPLLPLINPLVRERFEAIYRGLALAGLPEE
ncbi:MAG: tetratricopeptide repeat protein [Xanthobacteraceae bacterium]